MNKQTQIALGVCLVVGILYLLTNSNLFQGDKSAFENKKDCSKYYELAKQKIVDSGRVFDSRNESYTLNEVFYSPKMNSCLYAYTIHTATYDIYSIYDVFGGSVADVTSAEDFQKERAGLK